MKRGRTPGLRIFGALCALVGSVAFAGESASASGLDRPQGVTAPKVLWKLDTGG